MLTPIQTHDYKFSIPLTERETTEARKNGERHRTIRGVFRFRGTKGPKKNPVLVFREQASIGKDGIVTGGRTIRMSPEDFNVGLDLGKIKGRAKKSKS